MTGLLPVSDNKIGLDYKITRMLNGSLLDPVDAHFFWNGTFSNAEKQALLLNPIEQPQLPLAGGTTSCGWISSPIYPTTSFISATA